MSRDITSPSARPRPLAERPASAASSVAQWDPVGVYLTDGVFLFRLVDVMSSGAGEIAALEDCYGLDVVHVSVRELETRGLRVVTPAPTASPL